MKTQKTCTLFVLLAFLTTTTTAHSAKICTRYLNISPNSPINILDVFANGTKVIPIMFSIPVKKVNATVKKINEAWVAHIRPNNPGNTAVSKVVVLENRALVFTSVTPHIFNNIIAPLKPEISEVTHEFLTSKGIAQITSKATPDLLQILFHIGTDAEIIPTTILFEEDSDMDQNRNTLHSFGIESFDEVGKSVFANISKHQFEQLHAHLNVQRLGLQF